MYNVTRHLFFLLLLYSLNIPSIAMFNYLIMFKVIRASSSVRTAGSTSRFTWALLKCVTGDPHCRLQSYCFFQAYIFFLFGIGFCYDIGRL